jgi:hypothetical protein
VVFIVALKSWPCPPCRPQLWKPVAFPQAVPSLPVELRTLPTDLFLQISRSLTLSDVLRFARTSKSMWNSIMEPHMFNQIIREAMIYGCLRWIIPVEGAYDEVKRFDETARKWLRPSNAPPDETNDHDSDAHLLNATMLPTLETFPYLAFLRACFASHSMMNRRRIWGIVKQFDEIWSGHQSGNGPQTEKCVFFAWWLGLSHASLIIKTTDPTPTLSSVTAR